jgi:prepilin-type N-terminal cleavage/methylation domain-containing protein
MMRLNSSERNGGFTLIELLVVIAIVGLLSGIVLASLNAARDKANRTKLRADLQGVIKGVGQAQLAAGNTVMQITGTGCGPACGFNHTTKVASQTATVASMAALWVSLGFTTNLLDPWGNIYILDPNEGEVGGDLCRSDSFFSAGPNGIFDTVMAVGGTVAGDDYEYELPFISCTSGHAAYSGGNNFP